MATIEQEMRASRQAAEDIAILPPHGTEPTDGLDDHQTNDNQLQNHEQQKHHAPETPMGHDDPLKHVFHFHHHLRQR